nr:Myb domain containing protein [Haemonchus contortus]
MTSRLEAVDEDATVASEELTFTQFSEPISRRRLAFRPPPEPRPLSTTSNRPDGTIGDSASAPGPSKATGSSLSEEERLPRKSKTWSHDEIMVFYEGLKQCGKDFDGVMRIMAKRKVDKNKEQTKNYYFNLLKHVKQTISLDEDSMGDIGRDAKELFITINACEWRRRTHTNQYIPERMKELIFYGCTTVPIRDKSKKKSVPVKIKTPPCPSLLKFFYSNQLDKFPSEIIVSLKPMTYADASYVVSCEQNPLLRIRLNTNDRISRIFQLLRHKWSTALDRLDASGSRRSSGPRPEVRLFAGKDTEVGRVVLNATELAPAVGLSLNKLRKEREDREALKSQRSRNAPVNTEPSYTVSISHNFVLNEDIMKSGLCEENVQDAIAAEIYCLCGMTPVVELVYSVRIAPRMREPWRIMVSLLERDYGEAILDTRKRPVDATTERREDPPSKMRPVRSSRNKLMPQSNLGSPLNVIQEEAPQAQTVVQPLVSESSVVLEEYDSFAEQYNALRGKKGAKQKRRTLARIVAQPPNQTQITSFTAPKSVAMEALRVETSTSSADIMLGKQVSQYKARCAMERARSQNQGSSMDKAATDFSELCPTSFAHDFLSSLRTPDKTPAKSTRQEEDRSELMNRLFGGELSMSPTRASEGVSVAYRAPVDESAGRDLVERALNEASLTPSKMKAFATVHSSVALPDDVRSSMVEMMNQDSRDYVKKFEQLANTITASRTRARSDHTPDKKRKKRSR